MYDDIKQEIRDVVKPNFRNQINGQNLQDVLIDMVGDYEGHITSLEEKSGSWDAAGEWVTENSASVLTSESLHPIVQDLKDNIQDVRDTYATTASLLELSESVDTTVNNLSSSIDLTINNLSESVDNTIANLSSSVGSISSSLDAKIEGVISGSGFATTESLIQLSQSVAQDFANLDIPDISGLATTASVISLSSSFSSSLTDVSESISSSLTNLSESVEEMSSSFDQRIENSGAYIWVRGAGSGSAIQSGSGKADGRRAVAMGLGCEARGAYSVAEGYHTIANNEAEHALGYVNSAASGQVFSVGMGAQFSTGSWDWQYVHKNAISVIRKENPSGSVSASVYVYKVGSYEGDNPQPGVNDLATVIGNLSSSNANTSSSLRQISGSFNTRLLAVEDSSSIWERGSGSNSIIRKDSACNTGPDAISLGRGTVVWHHYMTCQTTPYPQPSPDNPKYSISNGWQDAQVGDYVCAYDNLAQAARIVEKGSDTTWNTYVKLSNYIGAPHHISKLEVCAAEGQGSLVEGLATVTTNAYEHAEGKYNFTSSNQIFSVGIGESSASRKNAVSILTGSGNVSASVYVYGLGGYDGTNPQAGVNDLTTVINSISVSGSTPADYPAVSASANLASASVAGLSRETWTFVMTDSSSVSLSLLVG